MNSHHPDGLSVAVTGDAIVLRNISAYPETDNRFQTVVDRLRGADGTVTNFESTVAAREDPPNALYSGIHLQSPSEVLDGLQVIGCDLFTAAHNHTLDFCHSGVESTIRAFERRSLPVAGIGRTLFEAATPTLLETGRGSIGLVNASSTFAAGSEAGPQTHAMAGRPGLNPLSVEKVYQVPEAQLDSLGTISDQLGIEEIKETWRSRGFRSGHDWDDDEYFHFMDMKFEVSNDGEAGIRYEIADSDRERVFRWLSEADKTADLVVMAYHYHECADGFVSSEETPEFLHTFARECIDAGADVFVGHGPHYLHGIEMYNERPIFYSLGNFVVQFDLAQRLAPETFDLYNLDSRATPSDIFDAWFYNDNGRPQDYLAEEAFWRTVIPTCDFRADGSVRSVELLPCTLQPDAPRQRRGIPLAATGDLADRILTEVQTKSSRYRTAIAIDDNLGTITP